MTPLHAVPRTPPPSSAAAEEDRLLASLAVSVQAERNFGQRLLRRNQRLRRLLAQMRRALEASRTELAHAHHDACCDALTGLPNRHGFEPPLRQVLAEHAGGAEVLALLFVDLDGFKAVNDRLGHAAGDELLRVVGARLAAGVRRGDLVCRHGGDEFLCLLPHLRSATRARAIAAALLRSITLPCRIATPGGPHGEVHEVQISASVGIAMYPRDGDTAPLLMRSADAAMYAAKSRRGGVAMARPLAVCAAPS
jgi:diguanylate cyclase